jgi:F0F1-type ATP synthase assembly protein I
MIYHKKRTQLVRIGLQLMYITLPPLLVLLLFLYSRNVPPDNLLSFLIGGLLCILIEALLLFKFFRHRIAEDNYDLVKISINDII